MIDKNRLLNSKEDLTQTILELNLKKKKLIK